MTEFCGVVIEMVDREEAIKELVGWRREVADHERVDVTKHPHCGGDAARSIERVVGGLCE